MSVTVVLLLALVGTVSAGFRPPSECAGLSCTENRVLRYNGTCICEPNPCQNQVCQDPVFPHLDFEYNREGELKCFCTKQCPNGLCGAVRKPAKCIEEGQFCLTNDHPVLVTKDGECACESHPCKDAGRTCGEPELPWLDFHYTADKTLECFCRQHPCPTFGCDPESEYPEVQWDQEGTCFCGKPSEEAEL